MTHEAAEAYACVAYRTMAYEGNAMSEEYLGILMEMLYGFYTPQEIKLIYRNDIQFDSYDAVMNDEKVKTIIICSILAEDSLIPGCRKRGRDNLTIS